MRAVWEAAGRLGQAKLKDAAKRKGITLSAEEVAAFVRAQLVNQVFAAPPKSAGKVTSPEWNERWQCDLVHYKAKSPEKNDGNRLF